MRVVRVSKCLVLIFLSHIVEFIKYEPTTIYLDSKSTKNTYQIYKMSPIQMHPKKLPNHERTFNIYLQYLKQKSKIFKSKDFKLKQHHYLKFIKFTY
jgi:hypothetical protein